MVVTKKIQVSTNGNSEVLDPGFPIFIRRRWIYPPQVDLSAAG